LKVSTLNFFNSDKEVFSLKNEKLKKKKRERRVGSNEVEKDWTYGECH